MIRAVNYVAMIRNRLLTLLHARMAVNGFAGVANVATPDDTAYVPRPLGKPSAGIASDFPQIDIENGAGDVPGYNPSPTTAVNGEPLEWECTQDFTFVVIHHGKQHDLNSQNDLEVIEAIRAGGRQLAVPGVADSALGFVSHWGPVTTARRSRRVKRAIRHTSRIGVRVTFILYPPELSQDV